MKLARRLHADPHTVHGDIAAELAALRERTVEQAKEVRLLELARLDGMTSGLWPHIQEGNAAAVSAGVRVSERRCRLLGIDAPVITKSELTGSLGVYAEKLEAERELFGKLSLEQLEEFAAASQALVDRAMAMVRANASPTLVGAAPAPAEQSPGTDVARSADRALPVGVSPSPAAAVDDAATGEAPDSLPQPR